MNPIYSDRLRLLKAIENVEKELNNDTIKKILKDIKNDKKGHLLSICQTNPDNVSFAQSANNKLTHRVSTTLSRYIRRQLNISYNQMNDVYLQHFSINVTSRTMKKKSFKGLIKILRGKDILDFYIKAHSKTMSCMTGAGNTEKIRMYAENPNKVCLVTAKDLGRSLLWICDDGTKFLDFIYPGTHDLAGKLIEDWARHRGYLYRQGIYASLSEKPLIKVTVKTTKKYPRLDTLHWVILDEKNKKAILHNKNVEGVNCNMCQVNGGFYRC